MKRVLLVGLCVGLLGCEDEDGLSGLMPIDAADASSQVAVDAGVSLDLGFDAVVPSDGSNFSDVAPDGPADTLADATPDAPLPVVATHTGRIEVLDVRLRNMGGAGVDGHGVSISIAFAKNADSKSPLMEESPSAVTGCKAWEYTPAQWLAAMGTDQGPVQVSATDGSPAFPPCVFVSGSGYMCPDLASSGIGGTLGAVGAPVGTSTFDTGGAALFGPEDVGRFLRLSNTATPSLNTSFPIVGLVNPTTAVIATGASISLVLPTTATYTTLAGAGPVPGTTSNTFFTDTEKVTVGKVASADFEAFSSNTGFLGANGIGDSFILGTANGKVLPTQIPLDGSAFTMGCDTTADCGQALGTVVNIVTTDAPVAGASPFSFPAMVTKRVHIRCVQIGASTVTVPAAYSALLPRAMSGATRIAVTFVRSNQAGAQNVSGPPNVTNMSGGHAELGFTTVPE